MPRRPNDEGAYHEAGGPSRRSQVSLGEDIRLTIPPPGLARVHVRQVVGLGALAGVGVLVFVLLPGSGFFSLAALLAALLVAVVAAYDVLRTLLDTTVVRVSGQAIRVTHSFPFARTRSVARAEFQGVMIGWRGLVEHGYSCHEWEGRPSELVAFGRHGILHFGEGLPVAEQEWMRDLIEEALAPEGKELATYEDESAAVIVQPPERFWRGVARYAAYCTAGAVALLAVLLLLHSGYSAIASAGVVLVFAATIAILAYRNYRLELATSGWHRAVVKSLAALTGRRFSASDTEGKARGLPDFPFFGGPRQFYNVVWGEEDDEGGMIAFDFTSRGWLRRNGVGCVLRVEGMSRETISIRPRYRYGPALVRRGIRLPGQQELAQAYVVTAENEGRAQSLLGAQVVRAISSWGGQGPPPWVCLSGGMAGFSIRRRFADNDRRMRAFHEYAGKVCAALEEQIAQLRARGSSPPSSAG